MTNFYRVGGPWLPRPPSPGSATGWDTPPCPVHAGIHMAATADGMHPTGMHSCLSMQNFQCVSTLA